MIGFVFFLTRAWGHKAIDFVSISSFLQEEKTKDVSYKHSSGLIKFIMPAHFDGFDHWPLKNVGKQAIKLQVRETDHLQERKPNFEPRGCFMCPKKPIKLGGEESLC